MRRLLETLGRIDIGAFEVQQIAFPGGMDFDDDGDQDFDDIDDLVDLLVGGASIGAVRTADVAVLMIGLSVVLMENTSAVMVSCRGVAGLFRGGH